MTGPRNARLRRLLQPDAWLRLDMRSAHPVALGLLRHGSGLARRCGSLCPARRGRHGPARRGPGAPGDVPRRRRGAHRLAEREDFYNYHRPHGAFVGKMPYEALRERLQ
jgi:hypothetical protein